MTEKAWDQPASGWEPDRVQFAQVSEASLTEREEEATRSALKNLNAKKRKSDPEAAQKAVSLLFSRYARGDLLPSLITGFLNRHWQPYMKQVYLREGEQSETWRNALESTENLIWSLQPKSDNESRRRLYVLLPELFQWLHFLLKSQQVAVSDEDLFFSELARLQVAALHANTDESARIGVAHEPVAGDKVEGQLGKAGDRIADSAGPANRKGSQPETDRPAKATSPELEPLRDLVVGAYVQFQSKRATKRVMRLEWISRSSSVYLFRDQRRGDTLCLTADRCIQCLRERSATMLSGERK